MTFSLKGLKTITNYQYEPAYGILLLLDILIMPPKWSIASLKTFRVREGGSLPLDPYLDVVCTLLRKSKILWKLGNDSICHHLAHIFQSFVSPKKDVYLIVYFFIISSIIGTSTVWYVGTCPYIGLT